MHLFLQIRDGPIPSQRIILKKELEYLFGAVPFFIKAAPTLGGAFAPGGRPINLRAHRLQITFSDAFFLVFQPYSRFGINEGHNR